MDYQAPELVEVASAQERDRTFLPRCGGGKQGLKSDEPRGFCRIIKIDSPLDIFDEESR